MLLQKAHSFRFSSSPFFRFCALDFLLGGKHVMSISPKNKLASQVKSRLTFNSILQLQWVATALNEIKEKVLLAMLANHHVTCHLMGNVLHFLGRRWSHGLHAGRGSGDTPCAQGDSTPKDSSLSGHLIDTLKNKKTGLPQSNRKKHREIEIYNVHHEIRQNIQHNMK